MGSLHEVDVHFVFAPRPIPPDQDALPPLRIGKGAAELSAKRSGDVTARSVPAVMLAE
jgi:hypothetical protein